MPSKPVSYRAVIGLQFADGKNADGDPVEFRVEPGERIPARFEIPDEWVDSGKVEVA